MLPSSEATRNIMEVYEAGMNGYAVKPLDFMKRQQLLSDLGTFRLVWNRTPASRRTAPGIGESIDVRQNYLFCKIKL